MWGNILSSVVGGVAKTLVNNGKNRVGAAQPAVNPPNYQGFMVPMQSAKTPTPSKPAPTAGGNDAVEAWMQLLSSYEAK